MAASPGEQPRPPRDDVSLSDLIRESLDTFTAGERKIARAILAHYPIAGLETIAELSQRAKVSAPSVTRFVGRLGFSGYPAFQKRLMREVQEALGSPLEQYSRTDLVSSREQFGALSNTFVNGLVETFEELPRSEFDAAVKLLSASRRRVHLAGGRFSQALASYLSWHLQMLRPDVFLVGFDEMSRIGALADTPRSGVLVLFDYRRYDSDMVRFAQQAAQQGRDIVLFTDRWLSPIAEVATIVLPARVESPSPFDSLVPATAVVETVIAGVTEAIGESGRKRLESIEKLRPEAERSSKVEAPAEIEKRGNV